MRWAHPSLWCLSALPLMWLCGQLALLLTGQGHQLGGEPGAAIMRNLGTFALVMLWVTLSISPLRQFFPSLTPLVRSRRMLGLWVFAYGVLHLLAYVVFVLGLDVSVLVDDLLTRPYAIAGGLAFVGLLPLAITSTRRWQKRLGRRWKSLHKLTYPIAVAAWVHLFWQVRSDYTESVIFGGILVLLLVARSGPVKKFKLGAI